MIMHRVLVKSKVRNNFALERSFGNKGTYLMSIVSLGFSSVLCH